MKKFTEDYAGVRTRRYFNHPSFIITNLYHYKIRWRLVMILKRGSRCEDVKKVQQALKLIQDGIYGPITEEAVKSFQLSQNLIADGIVGDKTWAKLFPIPAQNKRKINELIIHCSATPEGKDFTTIDIRNWHLQRGFSDIGYHYVIYRDGTIHAGRDEAIIGAHCTGHNANSIGVCYIGGLDKDGKTPKDTRTDAQKKSLINIVNDLKRRYPNAVIIPHNKYAAKACPCFDVQKEYTNI